MLINNTKHTKWDSEWQSRIKALSTNLDQAKNSQVVQLLTDGSALQTEKVKLEKEIRQLKNEQKALNQVFRYHRHAKGDYERLNDATHQTTHNPRQEAFLGVKANGTAVSGTKYQTNGWLKQAETHFTPTSGTLDNIYQVKISGADHETTEEQIIQTIARVVKALKKVDSADFEAKYNAKETDTGKQGKVKAYLKEITDQEIIIGSNKDSEGNAKQSTYDFANTYQKYDKSTDAWTNYTAPAFNYQHFFEFIALTHGQAFLNDLDNDKQKNIDKNENWAIFTKGDAYSAEQLKDYGIIIDSSKTTLYKTSETDKQTINNSGGITGWLDLAHSISQNANNQTKLVQALASSPTQTLLNDLKGWTQADGYITDGTNFTLPESLDSIEEIMDELETKKINNVADQSKIAKQLVDKNKELKTKNDDFKVKDTELDALIKEITDKEREKLKSYNIANGFADQNKRTENELFQIDQLLLTIRYLENSGDSNQPSSIAAENTAYDQIQKLWDKLIGGGDSQKDSIYLVRHFRELAWKKINADKTEYDISQAIERIKAGKYTDLDGKEQKTYWSLEEFAKHFENKDKLVKLTEWEQNAWKAVKEDKESEDEKLADWQSKLKALDPIITEAILTDAKMKDFQKHVNFKKIAGVEGLLKEVMEADANDATKFKVKADFINDYLKKEEAEVADLAKMITKFDAKKIIKLIKLFNYEKNLTAEKQQEYRRKYSWERDKKVDGKYVEENGDFTISDDDKKLDGDFTKFLFELATGAKSLTSITKPTGQEDNNQNQDPKSHLAKYWAWWVGGVGLVVIGGLIYAFWDTIKNWWEPKENEGESDDNE